MTTSTYTPFIESNLIEEESALRARLEEHGYLFFRNLLPADEVLDLRRDILELCAQAGWLDLSYDLMEAVIAKNQPALVEGQPEYSAVYRKVLQLPRFRDFPHQAPLMAVANKLLDDEVQVHARRIGRITFPNRDYAPTPPHQDWHYIRGSAQTYSCWVPLGECPMDLGGLAVWNGSQHRGFIEHNAVNKKAVVATGVEVDESEADWHTADFGLGDVLFFHSYTIHKALPNLSERTLRLSTDNRYQNQGDEIHPGSLQPHLPTR